MGLDMYLTGTKYFWQASNRSSSNKCPLEDGFPVQQITVHLGYWRKHQELHDWITKNIANGVDDCQEIILDAEQLGQILAAIGTTTDIYDIVNDGSEVHIKESSAKFAQALAWLAPIGRTNDHDVSLGVVYRASW